MEAAHRFGVPHRCRSPKNVETPRFGGNPRWGRLRIGGNGPKRKGTSRRQQVLVSAGRLRNREDASASETPPSGVPPETGRLYTFGEWAQPVSIHFRYRLNHSTIR